LDRNLETLTVPVEEINPRSWRESSGGKSNWEDSERITVSPCPAGIGEPVELNKVLGDNDPDRSIRKGGTILVWPNPVRRHPVFNVSPGDDEGDTTPDVGSRMGGGDDPPGAPIFRRRIGIMRLGVGSDSMPWPEEIEDCRDREKSRVTRRFDNIRGRGPRLGPTLGETGGVVAASLRADCRFVAKWFSELLV